MRIKAITALLAPLMLSFSLGALAQENTGQEKEAFCADMKLTAINIMNLRQQGVPIEITLGMYGDTEINKDLVISGYAVEEKELASEGDKEVLKFGDLVHDTCLDSYEDVYALMREKEEFCSAVRETAHVMMRLRQSGYPLQRLLDKAGISELDRELARASYDIVVYDTPELREEATEEFANSMKQGCFEYYDEIEK